MKTVLLSTYTDTDGMRVSTVLYGGCAVTAASTDHNFHAAYARALLNNAKKPTRLVAWDGDTGAEVELDRVNCLR